MVISINNKKYKVKEAHTEEEKKKGLQGVKKLPEDEGMLFFFDSSETPQFWMKNTEMPLDIIFINDDQEVTYVYKGEPHDEKLVGVLDTAYVLEVNQNSGIKEGDELEFDDDKAPVMKVLAPDGSTQVELWSGERIFSRKNTKVLIKKAKKADLSKDDKDYRTLGRFMFKCIHTQDNRKPEYVQAPEKKEETDTKTNSNEK